MKPTRIVRMLCLACAVSLPAAAVMAQDGRARLKEAKARFTAADTNQDGRLTREEAKDKMPFVFQHFDEIDRARAGSVSLADIAAYAKAQKAQKAQEAQEAGREGGE